MSSNNINSQPQNVNNLRQEGKFDIQGLNRLNEDSCDKLFTTKQSESPGMYRLTKHLDCECGIPNVVETAVENPMIQFRDGYGITECYMDDHTQLRIGKTKRIPNALINSSPDLTKQCLIWEEVPVILP